MPEPFRNRLKHAWNAFLSRDPTEMRVPNEGYGSSYKPDRVRLNYTNERSIISSIYNRIAIDVASIGIEHVRLDQNGRYIDTISSDLNECLTMRANADQTGRSFIQDVVLSLFDEGCIAVVPVDTTLDPNISTSYDIQSLRTAQILQWYPSSVRIRMYNDKTGRKGEITLPKKMVAIIENPLYHVMNEPNSTIKRLTRKLNLLDAIDEQSGSGKLDIIIQLPYLIKSQARKDQAAARRQDMEDQLSNSKYGVAYSDATEKVTQLNRPAENNLMAQITYLTSMLYSQLGITESVFNGMADEKEMLNYHNRTIEPVISSITNEMQNKFLTKTARTQNQSIMFFRDPFKLVPVNDLAEIADKFTRNAILSSNDFRAVMGYKPDADPKSDELSNKNISPPSENAPTTPDLSKLNKEEKMNAKTI